MRDSTEHLPPAAESSQCHGNAGPSRMVPGLVQRAAGRSRGRGDDYRTANGFWLTTTSSRPTPARPAKRSSSIVSASGWLPTVRSDSVQILVSTARRRPTVSHCFSTTFVRHHLTKYTYVLPHRPPVCCFRYLLYDGGPGGLNSDAVGLDNVRITATHLPPTLRPPVVGFDSVVVDSRHPIPLP